MHFRIHFIWNSPLIIFLRGFERATIYIYLHSSDFNDFLFHTTFHTSVTVTHVISNNAILQIPGFRQNSGYELCCITIVLKYLVDSKLDRICDITEAIYQNFNYTAINNHRTTFNRSVAGKSCVTSRNLTPLLVWWSLVVEAPLQLHYFLNPFRIPHYIKTCLISVHPSPPSRP